MTMSSKRPRSDAELVEESFVTPDQSNQPESRRSVVDVLQGGVGLAGGSRDTEQPGQEAAGPAVFLIGVYLLLVAIVFGWTIIAIFPETKRSSGSLPELEFGSLSVFGWYVMGPPLANSSDAAPLITLMPERGVILLALIAGVLGSFMHAAQSFAAYVGNKELKASWVWWYLLRPFVGAVLGVLTYFVIRAGMMGADGGGVSPYGVVALGGLAGCFSKNAMEKLAEVFDTLFRVDPARKARYKDTLSDSPEAPKIASIAPSPVKPTDTRLTIKGESFAADAIVMVNDSKCRVISVKASEVVIDLPTANRPAQGSNAAVKVVNPTPSRTESAPFSLTFE